MLKNRFKNNKGFTYIELIVVVSVFGMIAVVITSTFVLFSKAQARTAIREALVADTRNIIEVIAREIRKGKIDFDSYGGIIQNPVSSLHLKDDQGLSRSIVVKSSNCPGEISSCLVFSANGGVGFLSSEKTILENVSFYILPNSDPFEINDSGDFTSNEQPSVIVSLELSSRSHTLDETVDLQIETMITSKYYER